MKQKIILLFILALIVLSACDVLDHAIKAQQRTEQINREKPIEEAANYWFKDQYDQAITSARKGIELNPDDPRAWYWLGLAYAQKMNLDDAINALKKSIELRPENQKSGEQYQSSYLWLGISYYRKGEYERAIVEIKRAISLQPYDKSAHDILRTVEAEKAIIKEGNFTAGIAVLKRSLYEHSPERNYRIYLAGVLLLKLCEPEGAIKFAEEGLKFIPDDKKLQNLILEASIHIRDTANVRKLRGGLGLIGARMQDQSGEVMIYSVFPDMPAAKAGIQPGDRIIKVADIPAQNMEQVIKRIAQVEPGNQLTLQIRRGEQVFEKTLTVGSVLEMISDTANPSVCRAQTLNKEGVALVRGQKFSAALTKFEEAIQAAPGLIPKAYYNTAMILEQMGRPVDALKHYIKAQESFLMFEDEIDTLVRLIALTQRAKISVPESADRRYRVGIVRTQQKRYKEAIQEFEAAIAEAPWIVDAYYNLGLVCEFEKEYSQALHALRIYVRLAPNAPNIGPVKSKIVELEDKLGLLGKPAK